MFFIPSLYLYYSMVDGDSKLPVHLLRVFHTSHIDNIHIYHVSVCERRTTVACCSPNLLSMPLSAWFCFCFLESITDEALQSIWKIWITNKSISSTWNSLNDNARVEEIFMLDLKHCELSHIKFCENLFEIRHLKYV